jgi:hypothetical protein
MRRRLKWDPRMGRLATSIQLFAEELGAPIDIAIHDPEGKIWRERAARELGQARLAAEQRRVDDAWELLHAARRSLLEAAATADELRLIAVGLWFECDAKLTGYRHRSAAAALVDSGLVPVNVVAPTASQIGTTVAPIEMTVPEFETAQRRILAPVRSWGHKWAWNERAGQ